MRIPRTGVLLGGALALAVGLAALSTGVDAIYIVGLLAAIAAGALAGVLRSGARLRDFDRHAI